MTMVKNIQKKPAHLPERLTISFPIWGLYDTDGKGAYADYDKMMREHVERGFNCIRLDDGAGFMHDLEGNLLPPIMMRGGFGSLTPYMRQSHPFTPGFRCDVHRRLIELFEAAKRHNVFIILSSWYYLHTYWIADEKELNDSLYALDVHDRYMAFAKYLHYILCELEERGLDSQIAFAEIFNEANGLTFCGGYENMFNCPEEERLRFREDHIRAIDFLKERHPKILFAYDVSWPNLDECLAPDNVDIYNAHSYFMWSLYGGIEGDPERWLKKERYSKEDVINSSNYPDKLPADWIDRVWFYSNLDSTKIPKMEEVLAEEFEKKLGHFRDKLHRNLEAMKKDAQKLYPNAMLACGEGVSYIGSDLILFEEKSEEYWELMKEAALKYREYGLWGAVVRTCCGPEDPVWNMCPEKLLEVNRTFLNGSK